MFTIFPDTTQQGWECPKCHTVYAPWMAQCTSCPQTIVSSTGTTMCIHQYPEGQGTVTGGRLCIHCGQPEPPAFEPFTTTVGGTVGNDEWKCTVWYDPGAANNPEFSYTSIAPPDPNAPVLITRLLGV